MAVCSSSISGLSFSPSNPAIGKRKIIKWASKEDATHRKSSRKSILCCDAVRIRAAGSCSCCLHRRNFIGGIIGLLPVFPSSASDDPIAALNKFHPQKPDWYEEFYASAMDKTMESYEAAIAGYKSQLFSELKGNARIILEMGIGTGPNLRYYADSPGITVVGVDPNDKMERYALSAAVIAGIPPSNFKFIQAVAEALPLNDSSVDAVVGTLVLCSVTDVDKALSEVKRVLKPGGVYIFVEHVAARDATALRAFQEIFDPIQQIVADGCHLTRKSFSNIANAGFSKLHANHIYLPNFSLISPHVYGVAYR